MKKDKLHKVKSTGFKTPDHYFESFEDKLFDRLNENNSIENIETSGFTAPSDYFDSVEDKVFSKLNTENKSVINLQPRKTFYYVAGIAASLILLFAVFINTETTEESLSAEMVETYLENRDLNSYELAQLLSDTDLLEDDFTIATTPYEEDNLELYLLDNSDIETILEY
ncbi:hypothetical protein [Winogradskyella sp.]|uniref:hypothetical protein n=1 Tax=Winogradskyella sp. TaxID=1883156 RepID=UPI0025F92FA8|nr:hypothetical protein [Winogradskyella sp.]